MDIPVQRHLYYSPHYSIRAIVHLPAPRGRILKRTTLDAPPLIFPQVDKSSNGLGACEGSGARNRSTESVFVVQRTRYAVPSSGAAASNRSDSSCSGSLAFSIVLQLGPVRGSFRSLLSALVSPGRSIYSHGARLVSARDGRARFR